MLSQPANLPMNRASFAALPEYADEASKSDFDAWAQQQTAVTLITDVADLLEMPTSLVWDVMTTVSENMLGLLDSPQGWTTLAGFVAAELGRGPPDYMPRVH